MPESVNRPALTCFKAYDVRGQVGHNIAAEIVERIGYAFAQVMGPGDIIVGHDCRNSSAAFDAALARGLSRGGAHVLSIGLAGTEEVYFATDHCGAIGGIEITASHNPIDYNGLKMVGPGSRPLSDAEFKRIAELARFDIPADAPDAVPPTPIPVRADYARRIAGMVAANELPALTIVMNAGNGVAGPALDAIVLQLQKQGANLDVIRLNFEPDGTFPKGIPNPLLPENRAETSQAVIAHRADLGVAWDGDFDRCFFFDETGAFVDGEYVVGLLATGFLHSEPGATIVQDPRVIWNTQEQVRQHGGKTAFAKTGHAHAKRVMRETGAIYGGEISAHHYFRDFMCCDSGMIPWLKVVELMGRTNEPLSALVGGMRRAFPSSGELNFTIKDAATATAELYDTYAESAVEIDWLDGLSMSFGNWRFNLRSSSTEPLVRLNVETRGDHNLLTRKTDELVARLNAQGA